MVRSKVNIIAGVIFLLLGVVLFDAGGRHLVRSAFEHIYTPPALNEEKMAVYTKFVMLVEAYPEYSRVRLNMWGYRRLERLDSLKGQTVSSRCVDDDLIRISKGLKQVGCLLAIRDGSYLVFIPKRNYIMPTSPGVLYSLDGQNPNEIDNEFLNSKKPFMPIKDNWYMSRRLVTSPFRKFDAEWPLPKSFIDRSLRDPGSVHVDNR